MDRCIFLLLGLVGYCIRRHSEDPSGRKYYYRSARNICKHKILHFKATKTLCDIIELYDFNGDCTGLE